MANKKVTLTVTIEKNNYESLKSIIPSGKISEIVNKLIEKWVEEKEKEIANDYQNCVKEKTYRDHQLESWNLIHQSKIKADGKNEEE
ncbi:hypothetical protein [endosymbiont GvMRE of Glomus versiforme]|uniref:hypothetical protein n=1 Tax=endosymbiont GvMRE of Glomus versiforme TaxID=2039283 RepID=UPI000ED628E2|nr:hypothetical protein [endosymbiont GvMRE of Glomus versiforme]RHZ36142.1 hypothetical protein GvMRE_Ic2g121 [endosymbiont GvMRE of Glomus versiforme]